MKTFSDLLLVSNFIFLTKVLSNSHLDVPYSLMIKLVQITFFIVFIATLYLLYDLHKQLENVKKSNEEQDKVVFNLIRASINQNNLLLRGVLKYKNVTVSENDDF